jgi:tetratricopeptide (TPR) repeat protein
MEETKTHFQLGMEAYNSGDLDKAVTELEQAAREDLDNYRAFNYLGAAYASKGQYEMAVGSFKYAAQINPDIPSIHYNIAQTYEAMDELEEAMQEYEQALRIDPNYAKAYQAMKTLRDRIKRR